MKRRFSLVAVALLAMAGSALAQAPRAAAADQPAAASATPRENPFFSESTLPFHAPPFDQIRDSDYQPALEEGMKQNIAEIEKIANNPDAPTFDNTIVAMEKSGELLSRVAKVFFALSQADTNDTIQKVLSEEAPKLAAHSDAIFMNPKLFARVKAIYDHRDSLKLDPESKYLVEQDYKRFVRNGAELSDEAQAKLRELNQEESKLTTQFHDRVLADTNESAVVVSNKADLAGLSDAEIEAAAERAKDRGLKDKWVLPLQNTTQQPALQSLENRDLRTKLFEASVERGDHGGDNDTTSIIARLAQIRAQKAQIFGYPNYAAYVLDNQMAKTPDAAISLMTGMVDASTAKARSEAAKMQKIIDAQKGGFTLGPQDWEIYAEQVRKAEYDLDESQIKPYFELNRVLQDGVFYAANQLYGITFKERKDIPVYNPDVRVFEVDDTDGGPLALFYADYYARPSKSGGAWMDNFVDQSKLTGDLPVVYNVANFNKPAPGQPALLSYDDVTTMFHEFGHALHGMFSNVTYPSLSGANVARDFVEFPSQFNEHWALYPTVFANYAKHYKTGEPMPKELVAKIQKSSKFNQGYATTEYLAAALLDMAWHTLPANAPLQDPNVFEPASLKRFKIDMTQVPPRYHSTYFSHIWGGGYSAGYYSYLWAEVIDDDAWYWFKDHGGLTRENGDRLRKMVLSRGGTEEEGPMYHAFSGHEPSVEPLLEERGLKDVK